MLSLGLLVMILNTSMLATGPPWINGGKQCNNKRIILIECHPVCWRHSCIDGRLSIHMMLSWDPILKYNGKLSQYACYFMQRTEDRLSAQTSLTQATILTWSVKCDASSSLVNCGWLSLRFAVATNASSVTRSVTQLHHPQLVLNGWPLGKTMYFESPSI